MIRKTLITAVGVAVLAAGALMSSRADAMPIGLLSDSAGQINMTETVAFCFYADGWNGPGLYQCGYRMRRGFGWHGRRDGGRRVVRGGGRRGGHRH